MSILGYIDGDFKEWSVDLAGFRSQFPERIDESETTVSDLQALQRKYIERTLANDPERFRRMTVVIDTILQTRGESMSVLSLDPRSIMGDDEMRAMLISRDPHHEGRSPLIAHASKMAIHGGLSYELFLELKEQKDTDPDMRRMYIEMIECAARDFRKNHPGRHMPEDLSDLIARSITHDIMKKMHAMQIKQMSRKKTA